LPICAILKCRSGVNPGSRDEGFSFRPAFDNKDRFDPVNGGL
jgi:hypothetical protein